MGRIIDRRRVMGKKGLLPSGYTQVEYIENTSTAYINTGVYTVCDHTFELETTISWDTLGGRQLNGSDNTQWIGINGNKWDIGVTAGVVIAGRWYDVRAVVTKGNGVRQTYIYVDGTLILTTNPLSLPVPRNLQHIFIIGSDRYVVGQGKFSSYDKKKKWRIIRDGDVIRDYVPCISPTNVVGMYDTVEGQFYSSPNGVAFIAGPVV